MTINKISRSGTSVVTLAELQSGSAVFVQKASRVTTAGPVITGGLVSRADIIKRGVQVQTIVGRALANPYGSIFTFFDRLGLSDEAFLLLARAYYLADQFFITHDTPKLSINKGFNDAEPILERINLRIAAFRVFEDAQFVSTATKFTLTRPLADRQSLIDLARISVGYQRAAADIQTILDTRRQISIGKGNQDSVVQSDRIYKRATTLYRDQAITSEAKQLNPGKGLFDGVTVRNHDDPGPALYVTKLLRDATTILDLTGIFDGLTYQTIMSRFDEFGASDQLTRLVNFNRVFEDAEFISDSRLVVLNRLIKEEFALLDSKRLSIVKSNADTTTVNEIINRIFLARRVFEDVELITEAKQFFAGITKTDRTTMADAFRSSVGKARSDLVTVTESNRRSATKKLIDSILGDSRIAKLVRLGKADRTTIIDAALLAIFDSLVLEGDKVTPASAIAIKPGKKLADVFDNADRVYKFIGKTAAADTVSLTHIRPTFNVNKNLADSTLMLDLTAAFDGSTYNYGMSRSDSVFADTLWVRIVNARRTIEEVVLAADTFSKNRIIGDFAPRTDSFSLTDRILLGKIPFDTLYIGSGLAQRQSNVERVVFDYRMPISTTYRTLINDVDYFSGPQEYLIDVGAGQDFAGSLMFASTSVTGFVQVTSSGTGLGLNGGFVTPSSYMPRYVSFNGPGVRSIATVPLDLSVNTSTSIHFAVIGGKSTNGGEQPDIDEDLIIEYSIDDGTTFNTAGVLLATTTYGYPGWFEYSVPLPAQAQTPNTIIRWRQNKQTLSLGDNYGITNFKLGSTSFGTYIVTYNDKNTTPILDRISKGIPRVARDTARLIPIGYQIPIQRYEEWFQTEAFPENVRISSVAYASSTGVWYATSHDKILYGYRSDDDGVTWVADAALNNSRSTLWNVAADTVTGNTLVSVSFPAVTSTGARMFYSTNGGGNWNETSNFESDIIRDLTGSKNAANTYAKPLGVPLYIPPRNAFIFTYPAGLSAVTNYRYMYSTGTATSVLGSAWSRGGNMASGNTLVVGEAGRISWTGGAHGSGVALISTVDTTNDNALFGTHVIHYLLDSTSITAGFALSTSFTTSASGIFQGDPGINARPALAFGKGRFIWIGSNGWVATTTSPTVSLSWQVYRISGAAHTSNTSYIPSLLTSIAFDPVKQQFMIAQYSSVTSLASTGFWYSTSGTQSSWTFKSAATLRRSDANLQRHNAIWPKPIAVFTSGSTSIAQSIITVNAYPYTSTQVYTKYSGRLFTGSYVETQLTYTNDIDRVTFGYGIAAKQGVDRTFSGVTVTAFDTERLFIGGQERGTGLPTGTTGTLVSSYTLVHQGNQFFWSERIFNNVKTTTQATAVNNAAVDPQGYYTTAIKVISANASLSTINADCARTIAAEAPVLIFSLYVRGDGSSVGGRVSLALNSILTVLASTSITLTSSWTRHSVAYSYTPGSTTIYPELVLTGSNARFGNALPISSNLALGQALYTWGWQLNTAVTVTSNIPPYIRTTSTLRSAGTAIIEDYTTSITYDNSTYILIPSTSVSTVTSYTTIPPGNLWAWSEDFSNAEWKKAALTVDTDLAIAPDGTLTADKITKSGASSYLYKDFGIPLITTGLTYTMTFFVMGIGSSIGQYISAAYYDNSGTGSTTVGPQMQLTDKWKRYVWSITPTGNSNDKQFFIASPDQSFGDGTMWINESFYLWGASLTTGSGAKAYVRTTASALLAAATTSTYTEYSYDAVYDYRLISRVDQFPLERVTFGITNTRRDSVSIIDFAGGDLKFGGGTTKRDTVIVSDEVLKLRGIFGFRGAGGTLTVKTIDSGVDSFSSVAITQNAKSPDAVGIIDYITTLTAVGRGVADFISIGSGQDQRQRAEERIRFTITKLVPTTFSYTYAEGGNMIPWSEDFTSSPWAATNVTVIADQATAPDSTFTADKFVANTAFCYVQQPDVKLTQGKTYTHSVYLKGDGSSIGQRCAIGNFDGGSRVGQTSIVLTADWQRLSTSFTTQSSGPNRNLFIQLEGIAGANMAVGQSVFVWGYHVTTGSTLQAYVRTTSAPITTAGAIVSSQYTDNFVAMVERPFLLNTKPVRDTQNIGLPGFTGIRVSGDNRERTFLNYSLTAYAGTSGSIRIKTIDAGIVDTSVLQIFGARSPDVVGSVDRILLSFNKPTNFTDFISIGTDNGFRNSNSSETVKFLIGQRETDIQSIGFGTTGFVFRVSGSDLERTAFASTMLMKQGVNNTVSGITVAAAASGERLFVGQQYGTLRFAGDRQEKIVFDYSKILPAGSNSTTVVSTDRAALRLNVLVDNPSAVTAVAIIGSGLDGRWYDLERTIFAVTKNVPTGPKDGVIAGNQVLGVRRAADTSENISFNISLITKQGANNTVSGVTVAAAALGERVFTGQQYGAARFSGDAQERIRLDYFKPADNLSPAYVIVGRSEDDGSRWNISSETVKFTFGQRDTEIQSITERTALTVNLTAYRGTSGTITLNTIDPNPDVEFQQSSVTVGRGARSPDDVGMLDYFFLTYVTNRAIFDSILIGSGEDRRQALLERTFFTITKYFGDGVIPDDFLQTFDGLTYNGYKTLRETVPVGLGIGPRVSGSDVERILFNYSLTAYAGVAGSVRIKTIDAGKTDTSVLIGFGARSPDLVGVSDRVLISSVVPFIVNDFISIGTDNGFRNSNSSETTKFTISKRAVMDDTLGTTHPVQVGFGSSNSLGFKVSGSDLERTAFNVILRPKQGANNTVSGVTVAAAASGELLFVGQQYGTLRFAGDRQEKIVFDFSKTLEAGSNSGIVTSTDRPQLRLNLLADNLTTATVSIGSGLPDRWYDLEKTIFTITKNVPTGPKDSIVPGNLVTGLRRSGDSLESIIFDITMPMTRGVAGTVAIKTIDSPGNGAQSSVLIGFGARSPDLVGTVDRINLLSVVPRNIFDFFTIGTDAGFRQTQGLETTRFLIAMRKIETQLIGFGSGNSTGLRVSGDDLERTAFNITKRATQANYTTYTSGAAILYRGSPEIVRGNLVKFSEDFTQTAGGFYWQYNGAVSVTSNAVAGPFSAARNATKISESNTTLTFHMIYPVLGQTSAGVIASGTTLTASIYAKAAERSKLEINWSNYVNSLCYAVFDLSSGTVSAPGFWDQYPYNGDWTSVSATISAVGNGWYRCSLTTTKTNVGVGQAVYQAASEFAIHNGTTSTYVGTPGSGIYIWGAQNEYADSVGPYFPNYFSTQFVLYSNTANSNDFVLVGDRQPAPRNSYNQFENLSINFSKTLEAGSNLSIVATTDLTRTSSLFVRGRAFTQEDQPVLGKYEGNFRYALTQGTKFESVLTSDLAFVSIILIRTAADQSGDLDPLGNINTMVSNGSLRMTDYTDIDYLAEDYIGESRSFT